MKIDVALTEMISVRANMVQSMETGEWECDFWLVRKEAGDFFLGMQVFPSAISPMMIEPIVIRYMSTMLMDTANKMHQHLFEAMLKLMDVGAPANSPSKAAQTKDDDTTRTYQKWTKAENKKLLEYHFQKLPYNDIAAQMNRTESSVRNQISKLMAKLK